MNTTGVSGEPGKAADTWLLCRVGDRSVAVPLARVVEIMRPMPVSPVAGLPPAIAGVSLIRDQVVPVVDLGRLLGLSVTPSVSPVPDVTGPPDRSRAAAPPDPAGPTTAAEPGGRASARFVTITEPAPTSRTPGQDGQEAGRAAGTMQATSGTGAQGSDGPGPDALGTRVTRAAADRSGRAIALAVDEVPGVRSAADAVLHEVPSLLAAGDSRMLAAVGTLDRELLMVLGEARMVPDDAWAALKHGVPERGTAECETGERGTTECETGERGTTGRGAEAGR